jgi:NAD(P)-dependent dehydrogenase (short-subunit alcohol dehydrogenase family)
MQRLVDQVAIATGRASGIGGATARRLAGGGPARAAAEQECWRDVFAELTEQQTAQQSADGLGADHARGELGVRERETSEPLAPDRFDC